MNSKSQRKKQRRLERHQKNIQKGETQKQESWESGRLIKPQMSTYNSQWPEETCREFGERLVSRIKEYKQRVASGEFDDFELPSTPGVKYTRPELFVLKFRLYKRKAIDYILHYNQNIPKTPDYYYIKQALEIYWDTPEELYTKL
jgi:hypothetical protein